MINIFISTSQKWKYQKLKPTELLSAYPGGGEGGTLSMWDGSLSGYNTESLTVDHGG
jgi:hypothetical protein